MNEPKLKPIATILGKGFVSSEDVASLLSLPEGTKLYAIPDTHRVVSVELLSELIDVCETERWHCFAEELRAIIDNKGQS